MSPSYNFEADWRQYAFPEQDCHFSTEEELAERYTSIDLTETAEASGMPIISDGSRAVVNTENEHTIIFGGTASKKTRTLLIPTILNLAQAGESMIVIDIKGELSNGIAFPEIRGTLESNGYDCRFINFRTMDGDGFNILQEPAQVYRGGDKDRGCTMAHEVNSALAAIYAKSSADPFWQKTAEPWLNGVDRLLFEMCEDEREINLSTVSNYMDDDSCDNMRRITNLIESHHSTMTMLRNVLAEPERTRMSTLATANSMVSDFVINNKLLKMLSTSTFDIHDIHRRRTALFIIVPDEVDTYAGIVGIILKQITATLVQDAYAMGGALNRRVNLLCDEFCNYFIPGMSRAISAHRSRSIRWVLVCQSMKQLRNCYPEDADTILANCTNVYFLNSPEMELLEHLSKRSGTTTITEDGHPQPLISVSDLMGLKKGWTHTDVYFTSGNLHYVSKMPDVSLYHASKKYRKPIPMPVRSYPTPPVYDSERMYKDVYDMRSAHDAQKRGAYITAAQKMLAEKYKKLFVED